MITDLDGERGVSEEVIELCADKRRNSIDRHGQVSVVYAPTTVLTAVRSQLINDGAVA
ncbi:hypothetical protein U1Q18_042550, partial [Sarracenia purpurea var. burkii]